MATSISARMAIAGALIATAAIGVTIAIVATIGALDARRAFDTSANALTADVAASIAPSLLLAVEAAPGEEQTYNRRVLAVTLKRAAAPLEGRMAAVTVFGRGGEQLAHWSTDERPPADPPADVAALLAEPQIVDGDGEALFTTPAMVAGGPTIGAVSAVWSTATIDAARARTIAVGVAAAVIASLIASGVLWILAARLVQRPVLALNDALSALAQRRYDAPTPDARGAVEIEAMTRSLDALRADLRVSDAAQTEAAAARAAAEAARKTLLDDLAADHQAIVGDVIAKVGQSADALHAQAGALADAAKAAEARAGDAVSAAESGRAGVGAIETASGDVTGACILYTSPSPRD